MARTGRPLWTCVCSRTISDGRRVASWAYTQAERAEATVWQEGKDGLVALDHRWRKLLVPIP